MMMGSDLFFVGIGDTITLPYTAYETLRREFFPPDASAFYAERNRHAKKNPKPQAAAQAKPSAPAAAVAKPQAAGDTKPAPEVTSQPQTGTP